MPSTWKRPEPIVRTVGAVLIPCPYAGMSASTLIERSSGVSDLSVGSTVIRADKARRLVALLIDGALLKQWIDKKRFAGVGGGVRFIHQGNGMVKLSHIRIEEWDGQFARVLETPQNLTQDQTELKNGQTREGTIQSMDPSTIRLADAKQDPIPFHQVLQLHFAPDPQSPPSEHLPRFQGILPNGDRISFSVRRWANGVIEATAPAFDRAFLQSLYFSKFVVRPLPDR